MAVTYEVSDRIATIVLDRQQALNSFDREQYAAFAEACARFKDDDDAWAAIITGAGDRAFSAGADLRDMIPALMDEPSKERFRTGSEHHAGDVHRQAADRGDQRLRLRRRT